MFYLSFLFSLLFVCTLAAPEQKQTKHLRLIREKRDDKPLEPIVGTKRSNILSGENDQLAFQNPDALQPPPTDRGNVVNLKWSMTLSNMLLSNGGFVREQVRSFLPATHCGSKNVDK